MRLENVFKKNKESGSNIFNSKHQLELAWKMKKARGMASRLLPSSQNLRNFRKPDNDI